jgi:alpha-L-rhamnosidase
MLRLVVELEDGKMVDLVSDPDWKVTDQGPIVFNSVRSGETYDARRELRGWAATGFNASAWKDVDLLKAPGGRVVRQNLEPIKVRRALPVQEIKEPEPGVHVFHFGQNFAGWVRLRVAGPAGTRVRLRYGESLNPKGRLDTKAIDTYTHGRFQTDEYVLKGDGVEEWSPRFCYHGFRYVEVTGLPAAPTRETLDARVVHSAVEPVGTFSCSDDRINRIHDACVWTLTSNIHSIPQDCPHREKLGWMADGLAAAGQAVYNFDMERFYAKWIADMRAAQNPKTGFVSPIVPDAGWSYGYIDPCWSGASVILPWRMYLHYGDRRFLSDNFAMMKAYTDSLAAHAKGHVVSHGQWSDWMGPDPGRGVTSTAYYYQCARIVSESAKILNDTGNATRYAALADEIGQAFRAAFLDTNTKAAKQLAQTTFGLALALGMVPDADRQAVADQFAKVVGQQNRPHIRAGIVGMPYVLKALTEQGRADLVWAMVTQPDAPGWLALLANGKNTIDESWGGGPSGNHPAFSAVDAWFYASLAGIMPDPSGPGFKRFVIWPQPAGDLKWVKARYDSIHGPIESHWEIADGKITLTVAVPANTTATIHIPTTDPARITESGKLVGRAVCEVGSGRYTYVAPYGEKSSIETQRHNAKEQNR